MVIVPVNMIGSASPLFQWVTPTGTPTATPTVEIYTPSSGQAVQGKVSVVGVTAVQDFQLAELYFGYMVFDRAICRTAGRRGDRNLGY